MVKIAAMGDNVVDCYISRGEMFPGGNCLNVSALVRRFDGTSAYIGAIGRDPAGRAIVRALEAEGVDISHLRQLDGPTAYCIIGHRDGDRVFISFDLGVSMFAPSTDDLEFLREFSAVHIGQSSGLDDHLRAAAQRTLLSYDFSTRRDAWHRQAIAPLCFLASVSGGNLDDAEVEAICAELIGAGTKWVLVTRGQQGARLSGAGGTFTVSAAPADVVDTLGAGDTFIARTLLGLLRSEDPESLLAEAATAAAATCGYFGAFEHGAPLDIGADTSALATEF